MAAEHGDIKAHEQTYDGFVSLIKWGSIASFLVVALVVWLLAS